jgi:hypothetical protein
MSADQNFSIYYLRKSAFICGQFFLSMSRL